MKTETKETVKLSKQNSILAISRKNNPYTLFAVGHTPFDKGFVAGFEKCEEMNRNKIDNYDSLLDIAKRCEFIFGNEANYPEGTIGYRLAQDAKSVISKSKE